MVSKFVDRDGETPADSLEGEGIGDGTLESVGGASERLDDTPIRIGDGGDDDGGGGKGG